MIFERIRHPFSPSVQSGEGPDVELPDRIVFEGVRKQALETGRNRLMVTGVLFALAFVIIGGRVVELTLVSKGLSERPPRLANTDTTLNLRADITDRNGILLATSLPTAALYANPRHVLDAHEAADVHWVRPEQCHRFVWRRLAAEDVHDHERRGHDPQDDS